MRTYTVVRACDYKAIAVFTGPDNTWKGLRKAHNLANKLNAVHGARTHSVRPGVSPG